PDGRPAGAAPQRPAASTRHSAPRSTIAHQGLGSTARRRAGGQGVAEVGEVDLDAAADRVGGLVGGGAGPEGDLGEHRDDQGAAADELAQRRLQLGLPAHDLDVEDGVRFLPDLLGQVARDVVGNVYPLDGAAVRPEVPDLVALDGEVVPEAGVGDVGVLEVV